MAVTKGNRREGKTIFELIGGMLTCRQIATKFHVKVAEDGLLSALFPRNMQALDERFTAFIAWQFGGPSDYLETRGKTSLVCRHSHLPIGTDEAERWLKLIFNILDELGIPDEAKSEMRGYFSKTAQLLKDPFRPYYDMPLGALRETLTSEAALATTEHYGKSLILHAAGQWDAERLELLIDFGAPVSTETRLGHGPLYRAANAQFVGREEDGCAVIEILMRNGASVDWASGPNKCTPLHMAARRGNARIAEALLCAGASLETQDIKGETPLRRAVNCGQIKVAKLLLDYGANPNSRDNRGLSVIEAARTDAMRELLSCTPSPRR